MSKLKYIKFRNLNLNTGKIWEENTKNYETVVVILSGKCELEINGKKFGIIGKRKDVFSGKASAAYIPIKSTYRIKAVTKLEVAVCQALAKRKFEPKIITPKDVKIRVVGKGNWKRNVHDIVDKNVPADRILVGETMNPPGNWSSSPPHKHDIENLPKETKQEELYFFKIKPEQGFGIQRIYSPSRNFDKSYVLFNNTVISIPYGYHPVVAAPGYKLYYLWILAGKNRLLVPCDDPKHSWIKGDVK